MRPYLKKLFRVFLTSLIYLLYFLILYYLLDLLLGIKHPAPAGLIMLVIAVYFHEPTTWAVRHFIDRNFYRKIFSINKSLNQFNIELNSTLDFQELVNKLIAFLEQTFPDQAWAFYLCWGEDFELFKDNRMDSPIPKLIKLPPTGKMDEILTHEINFHTLSKLKQKHEALSPVFDAFPDSDRLHHFFPLRSYKGYVGFLLFERDFGYFLNFWELKKFLVRIFRKSADVLENAQLYSEVKRKSLQNYLLLEVGKKISASLNLNEVLESIIDSIQQLMSYDAAGIFLIDQKKKQLRRMVTRGYDEALLDKLSLKLDLGSYGQVIQEKKPSIVNDVARDTHYYSVKKTTRSQLTVPLLDGDNVIGILALESDKLNHYTPLDRELLMTFASQGVIAIENAQLYEASLQKKRLESELVVASEVQKALLPERPDCIPGVQVSSINIPARIVGGDLFDIFRITHAQLGVSIGDVSGKGAPASILMAMLYAGFKSLLKEIYPVVEVVARLNNLLTETTVAGHFVTFFYGIIDVENKQLTYTNAGHNPPILIHRDKTVERLETGGIVLGFLKNQEYIQKSLELRSGDYLILFTDGITEVKNSQGEEFGEERLIKFLKRHYHREPKELRTLLLNEIKKYSLQEELTDDVTLVITYIN